MNKIQKNYKDVFDIIREELNKVDPLGAIASNSMLIDEYDTENQKIITLINDYSNYKEFAEKICEIFIESTEMKFNPQNFYECAKNILEKTKNLTLK